MIKIIENHVRPYTSSKERYEKLYAMEIEWLQIDPNWKTNKINENTEFSIIETIKGWIHILVKKDLTQLKVPNYKYIQKSKE